MKIPYETLKQALRRAVNRGLVVHHPEKNGHSFRYVLANMQDYPIHEKKSRKKNNSDMDIDINELCQSTALVMGILYEWTGKNHKTFHNISFSCELTDKDDYTLLQLDIFSQYNKAKVHEFRISRHRFCSITFYPNGRVTMIIRCSKEPFELFVDDGRNDLLTVCGQILHEIKIVTNNLDPLETDISDWKVYQIDGAYDIPIHEIEEKMTENKLSHEHGLLAFRRWGVIRIKDLYGLCQFYEKMMPLLGPCLRLERRFSFKNLQPDIETFVNSCS